MDYKKEFLQILDRYEDNFGLLPFDFHTNYATVELICMMKRALEESKALKVDDEDTGYEFL